MNIEKELLEFVRKYDLKSKAFKNVEQVLDNCISSDINYLKGHDRGELIFECGNVEFQNDKYGRSRIVTKINIYSRRLYGDNFDLPVGCYEEWTSLKGEHLDEFISFDWFPIQFNLIPFIEELSQVVPKKYFRRNDIHYKFVSYVSHALTLFQSRQYDGTMIFVKRGLEYIERQKEYPLDSDYQQACIDLFTGLFHFVKSESLMDKEALDRLRIDVRLKNKANK